MKSSGFVLGRSLLCCVIFILLGSTPSLCNRELKTQHRSKRAIEVSDPMWSQQWYLYRDSGSSSGADMNSMVAWDYATGAGVTIGVVDGGVLENSEDIRVNTELTLDLHPGQPIDADSTGTEAAGVAAALRNAKCGVGIAYEAQIANIRLFSKAANVIRDDLRAKALTHRLDKIDIYLNNWSANEDAGDNSRKLFRMSPQSSQALYKGIREGRGGKGAIYIWASGKGGLLSGDSCSYDEYVNNIYTIAVAGIKEDNRRLLRGERCSAIIVSAYSADSGETGTLDATMQQQSLRNIVSPSGKSISECDTDFAESGAAASMVAGAAALALQVNPKLTWRDMQHLIIRTSNPYIGFRTKQNRDEFITNAANFKVSPTFGFGLLDIGKMVKLARKWPELPKNMTCIIPGRLIANKNQIPQYFNAEVNRYCKIEYIEHVEVRFHLTYSNKRGRVSARLESPARTESIILNGREPDITLEELRWQTVTYAFWGEQPQGLWRLHIDDASPSDLNRGSGTLFDYTLIIHGMNERTLPEYEGPHDDLVYKFRLPWWAILIIVVSIVLIVVVGLVIWRCRVVRRNLLRKEELKKAAVTNKVYLHDEMEITEKHI
ncbi:endoprotease bli-like isoform X2 [Tubulanus polymorphus]|uniref:endoprotease bli-like isoform X2 n=1 Tax=Tubulanus polymorphus TaxID=672921 RepID=UPI003DA394FC